MPDTKKDKQLFTVARVFFLLIVIPLSLMAILIANGIFKLGITAKERAVTVLDQKSQEEIKIRTINTADEVASFLSERKKDLLVATIIPATEAAFKQFVNENKRNIWVKSNDKIVQEPALLYTEMALIDRNGNEQIKISNGQVVPKSKLVNVSNPANTLYKSEDYFNKAKALNKGDIYVGRVTGWYVNRQEFEQQNKRFTGVIRFATPLFSKEGFAGVVVLALDYRHLAGFTDHIIPTQAQLVFEADASTGNYAYMVDNKGFMISHPNDYHIAGLYKDGRPVPPLTEKTAEEQVKKGEEVLNLNLLGFMDPNLPEIAKDAAAGNSGIKTYKFGGHTKFVAYAPIKFFTDDYPKPGGFGWVGMGVDVEKWNELAVATSQKIEKEAKAWSTTIILILIISVVILFLISALLARGISRSIAAEVPEGSQEVVDYYEDEEEDNK
ncbi:MAG: cache domain-containing protein [Syntrophobacterales bacterium]|nr:cache domain-containing protein [Syntrophobacterales bacterium]HRT27422.1 cache domain-containing protein [Syntrophales bacterium]